MSFQDKYSKIIDIVKPDIEKVKDELNIGIELQEPLQSKLSALINAPSKHIRCAVSFLYLKALGQNIDNKQISLQTAVELIHNASLIHDDIIDEGTERRNQTTINKSSGNKLAVISGDYLLSVALKKICTLNSPEIIKIFAQTLDEMCQGEVSQHLNRFKIPSPENYLKKTEQKTAKLFVTAIYSSVLLSGVKDDPTEFAKNLGTAFQIRDDLINIKTSKSDLKDGIYTAPVIFAGSVKNYKNGIEKTKDLLNNYVDNAQKSIKYFENNKYKSALTELLELFRNE